MVKLLLDDNKSLPKTNGGPRTRTSRVMANPPFKLTSNLGIHTPWKFNSEFTPENIPGPKRRGSSSNHHFAGSMLNFLREGIFGTFFQAKVLKF